MILSRDEIKEGVENGLIIVKPTPTEQQYSSSSLDLRLGREFYYWDPEKTRQSLLGVGSDRADVGREEDYELWFRCAKAGLCFANLAMPLVHIRSGGATLKRHSLRTLRQQVWIGWLGCWAVRASPLDYVGVAVPMLRGLVPPRFRPWAHRLLKPFEPRAKAGSK